MSRKNRVLCFALMLGVLGCVPSLHPFYTETDLIWEPALLGVWLEKQDSKDSWTFEDAGKKTYKLTYEEEGKKGVFDARLFKVKDAMFLDLYPRELDSPQNEFYKMHFLPVHTVLHIRQIRPILEMRAMDPGWLKKFLTENPTAVAHEIVLEDTVVLTAPPAKLQEFILSHLEDKDAFGDFSNLSPKSEEPKEKPAP